LKENQNLKIKFLEIFTTLNDFENNNFDSISKENEKLIHQLLKENDQLRQVAEKTIFTECIIKKEIKGDSLDDLEKFKTNYLEEYKKFKSNQIKQELNIDTTFQTIKTETSEDYKDQVNFQPRSHFIPPMLKKEKVKKQLKNIKIETDINEQNDNEIVYKTSNGLDEILLSIKSITEPSKSPLFPKISDIPKQQSHFPTLLNESFEIAPFNESPSKAMSIKYL
jgi:hypothetical protein